MRSRISEQALQTAKAVHNRLFDQSYAEALRLKDAIFRLAKEFEQANERPPAPDELWDEFKQRLDGRGKVSFIFNNASRLDKKYNDLYRALTSEEMPQSKRDKYTRVYGDGSEIEAELHKVRSHDVTSLIGKLDYYLGSYQIAAAEKIIAYAGTHLPETERKDFNSQLNQDLARKYLHPLSFVSNVEHSEAQINISEQFRNFALKCGLPVSYAFGIVEYFPTSKPPFRTDTFIKIREFLSYEIDDIADLNRRAGAMASFFPEYKNFVKYCERWPSFQDGCLALKANADLEFWDKYQELDYCAEWGEALLQYGPQILYYFEHGNDHQPLPRNAKGVISLKSLKEQVYDVLVERQPVENGFEELHRFCFDHQLSICDDFEGAKYLITEYGHLVRDSDFIPPLEIDGKRFGLPGYQFHLLDDDDFRAFFPGRFTNCCERLFRHCQNSVIHSYKTRESGFFVITDPQDTIIAHSWAWRSRDNVLMLDGFEARETDKRINDGVIRNLLHAISRELSLEEYADYNIPALALGMSGKSLKPHEGFPALKFDETHMIDMIWADEADEQVFGPINGQDIGFSESFYLVKSYTSENRFLLTPKP